MIPRRWHTTAGLILLAAMATTGQAQQAMHIGYVYPAGGKQGTTFETIIAGQFLGNVSNIHVSGNGVSGKVVTIIRPISGKEINDARIEIDQLLARRAVVRKDFKALEMFRSFKNANSVKTDSHINDKEIEELKKKYAGATWTPRDEDRLTEIRKKLAAAVRRPANPAISELVVVQMSIAPDAAPGRREMRIGAAEGLSNPLVFHVGRLPEFTKPASKGIAEQNKAMAKTAALGKTPKKEAETKISIPTVVNGQILPGQIDRYRFTARKGQRLVIAVQARDLIPYIADAVPGWFQATLALYDANGKELAYDDDFRFNPDPVLYYETAADGEYVIEIKDSIYRGRQDFVYRITIGEVPFITSIFPLGGPAGVPTKVELKGWNLPVSQTTIEPLVPGIRAITVGKEPQISNRAPFAVDTLPECLEQEPNDTPQQAQRVRLPIIVNGRIDRPDDVDVFRFEGKAGQEIVAEVIARRLNSPVDSVLRLTDAQGQQLAMNDDFEDKGWGLLTHHADSYIRYKLPSDGTYYVYMADMQHNGGPEYGYRLRLSGPRADFALRIAPSSITARFMPTVPITVHALRRDGFDGDITLALKDPPQGFALSGGTIPAGQNQVRLTLSVPPGGTHEPVNLHLEGRATVDGREIVRPVVPAEDMMQAFEYRHLVPSKELKVAVASLAMKGTFKLLSETPVKIPAGGTLKVRISGPTWALKRFRLALSNPPEGITLLGMSPSREGAELVFQADARVKPGLKGNLILGASPGDRPAGNKPKPMPALAGRSLVALPAIAFEVVAK